jgi:hypothetical protein
MTTEMAKVAVEVSKATHRMAFRFQEKDHQDAYQR